MPPKRSGSRKAKPPSKKMPPAVAKAIARAPRTQAQLLKAAKPYAEALSEAARLLKGVHMPEQSARPAVVDAYIAAVNKAKERVKKDQTKSADQRQRIVGHLDFLIRRAEMKGQTHVDPNMRYRVINRRPQND